MKRASVWWLVPVLVLVGPRPAAGQSVANDPRVSNAL
jgi:hypothetical protein